MNGSGVHTFTLINKANQPTLVKFHWLPTAGAYMSQPNQPSRMKCAHSSMCLLEPAWTGSSQRDSRRQGCRINVCPPKAARWGIALPCMIGWKWLQPA